jgi:hypothetical protein
MVTNRGQSSRSNSNVCYKVDRFIPFRGTSDNFIEEYIINNDLYKEAKGKDNGSSSN